MHLYLSWSVLKRVLRSCFTAWRSASLPSAENASEYAAPFPPAFWLAEPISFGFCPSAAGRLLGASSSACFRAAALVLAKPAARSDFDAHAHAAPQGWTPSDARQRHAGKTLVLHLSLGRSAGEQQWRVYPVACFRSISRLHHFQCMARSCCSTGGLLTRQDGARVVLLAEVHGHAVLHHAV